MTELIWDGKYDSAGHKIAPARRVLPFQTVEIVNGSASEEQKTPDLCRMPHETTWQNRLLWGDKKYVLPSLLPEFAGKINLIYIDPPFDTGTDFSFKTTISGRRTSPATEATEKSSLLKDPVVIEQKAYRDIWGKGLDSYLTWFYETVVLLRDLLAEDGSLYVHLDWHVGHYAKAVMDEVFGIECFQNEIAWCYREAINSTKRWNRKHDNILLYSRSAEGFYFNANAVLQTHSPVTIAKYKYQDEKGRYRLMGRGIVGSPIHSARDISPEWEKTHPELVYRHYLRDGTYGVDYLNIDIINQAAHERVNYPTQKPETLLEQLLKASSRVGDLVLDCFCGSGTTGVVAEKLGRRWILCDLGRYAVHTTTKRLLSTENIGPFIVQQLGKYERQQWQEAEFGEHAENRQSAYRSFLLDLYKAQTLSGYVWLHGVKEGRMVHIGAIDRPVRVEDVHAIVEEFRHVLRSERDVLIENCIDVLGWDFAFEGGEVGGEQDALEGIALRFLRIPREVLEKKAVAQGEIRFAELATVCVDLQQEERNVTLCLEDFLIPLEDSPDAVQKAVTHWEQWIDYWAVDWDHRGDTFRNQWRTYRTRKDRALQKQAAYDYPAPGTYRIVVRVVDILGNETTKTFAVQIP